MESSTRRWKDDWPMLAGVRDVGTQAGDAERDTGKTNRLAAAAHLFEM
jgi:hypothetical protein